MANPAHAVVDALARLRLRLPTRRMKDGEPATSTQSPAARLKRWTLYYDKARRPERDYEDKGGPAPHG